MSSHPTIPPTDADIRRLLLLRCVTPNLTKKFRAFEGLTQRALAEQACVDFWRLFRFEKGARLKDPEKQRLLDALSSLRTFANACVDKRLGPVL